MTTTEPEFLSSFNPYIAGAVWTLTTVAALLFLRYYRKTRDLLFLFFAGSFLLQALARFMGFLLRDTELGRWPIYVLRVIAYGLILFAIWHKNRSRRMKGPA